MNQRLLLLVVVVAALLGVLWYALGRGVERSGGALAPAGAPSLAEAPASATELQAPASAPSVVSERSALSDPDPVRAPDEFERDHASFPTAGARWLEVTLRFPAPIPAEDAPALIAFAGLEEGEQLDESDLRDILRALDMSERFVTELDDDVGWSRRALSGDSSVRLPFPPRAERALLVLQSRYFLLEPVSVELRAAGAQVLEPTLGAWVTGRCVLPPGAQERGIAAEDVSIAFHGSEKDGAFMSSGQSVEREVELADDFGFELCALSADHRYMIDGETDGLAPYLSTGLEVAAGEHKTLEIAFELGATLTGRVLGDDGTPIEGAEVSTEARRLGMWGRGNPEATTGADGSFELDGVRAGKVMLRAKREGWRPGRSDAFSVANGDVVRGVELVLDSGRKISGSVVWADGSPAVGATVEARQREAYEVDTLRSEVDASGAFVLRGFGDELVEVVAECAPDDGVRERLGVPPATEAQGKREIAGPHDLTEIELLQRTLGRPRSLEWLTIASGVAPDTHGLVLTLRPPLAAVGSVCDDTGAPIAKFRVRAEPAAGSLAADPVARFEAPDGAFRLDVPYAGEWGFRAEADGFASSGEPLVVRVPGNEPLRLVLARAATLSGRVVDPDGHPVANAQIRYSTDQSPGNFVFRGEGAASDAGGAFTLDQIDGPRVTLVADHDEWAASEPLAVDLEPGKAHADVVLVLRVGARISGEVLDAEGRPEPGQNVTYGSSWFGNSEHTARTDAAGRFAFEHVTPGKIMVSAVPSRIEMFEAIANAEDRTAITSIMGQMRTTTVEVADGGEAHVVLGAKAKSPVRVTGRITSASEPLVDAGLVVLAEGGALLSGAKAARSDGDGRFEVVLDRPGDHVFGVSTAGFGDGMDVQFYVSVPEAAEFEVELALPLGRIEGRVRGPDGSPVAGVNVRVAESGGILGIEDIDDARTKATAGDGSFAFEHLRAGRYALYAGTPSPYSDEAPRFATSILEDIDVGEDESVDGIEIRLAMSGKLAGTVRDDSGRPVAGATVFVRDEKGRTLAPISICRSDAGGRFVHAGLPPGRVSASARAQDHASPDSDPVTIRAGETSEVDLVLARGTYLVVSLLDGDETVRARLRVLDEEERVVSDLFTQDHLEDLFAEGFSSKERRVGPLPPGRYTLIAVSFDGKEAKKSVSVEAGQEERHVKLRLK